PSHVGSKTDARAAAGSSPKMEPDQGKADCHRTPTVGSTFVRNDDRGSSEKTGLSRHPFDDGPEPKSAPQLPPTSTCAVIEIHLCTQDVPS
ncbi:MAG: hypothetical protein KDA84_22010, partial [Planctomycetaceae bacterium]|nr:hypothetical protein [Planctomycetaceae bacterium]